jgi:hypothetical protein
VPSQQAVPFILLQIEIPDPKREFIASFPSLRLRVKKSSESWLKLNLYALAKISNLRHAALDTIW